jgi:hypothetical protein
VTPALLAIGDDIEARNLLIAKREQDRVVLRLTKRFAFEAVRRVHALLLWIREPDGPRQAADDHRSKHDCLLSGLT